MVEIQNHHQMDDENWRRKTDNVHEAYIEENKKTYLCTNLFRSQMKGLVKNLERKKYPVNISGFSSTGAARTVSVDMKAIYEECMNSQPGKDLFKEITERYCV